MTLTLNLPPELEDQLLRAAERHGLSAGEYVCRLIEQQLRSQHGERKSLWETLTPHEWERAFDGYLASHDPTKPPLPSEALERASFYGERG